MPDSEDHLKLLYGLRRYAEGRDTAREAIAADPDWADGYFWLALFLRNDGYLQEARQAVEDGLRRSPNSAWGHAILARCQFSLGRYPEAQKAVREALRLDPAYAFGYVVAAEIYYRQKRFPAARAAVTEGLRRDPAQLDLLLWLGWIEFQAEAYGRALAAAEDGLHIDPTSPGLLNLLAFALRARGLPDDLERSERALNDAIRLDPNEVAFRQNVEILAAWQPAKRPVVNSCFSTERHTEASRSPNAPDLNQPRQV